MPERPSQATAETAIIWGRRPVVEALRARRLNRVAVANGIHDDRFLTEVRALAAETSTRIEMADRQRIESLAPGRSHQGIIGEALPASIGSVSEMLSRARSSGEPALLLVVDQIQDPMNLGSLIRSAEVAGAHGVVITERRTAPLSGAVSKASAGAVHHLPVGQVANLSALFAELGRAQVWTLGLVAGARGSIYECDLTIPLAIVVGSEGRGLRSLTEKRIDLVASIPTHGQVASLNAAVAGAIALFETQRQRIRG